MLLLAHAVWHICVGTVSFGSGMPWASVVKSTQILGV